MKTINLTQNKVAVVDDSDYDYLMQWNWNAFFSRHNWYACRSCRINGKKAVLKMHRVIMGCSHNDGKIIDHADNNGLNNQKSNLRISTSSQNNANRKSAKNSSSKYLGVYWDNSSGKWRAAIKKNKKITHLGRFKNEIDAALAYNKAAEKIHGEYSRLNIIECHV